MLLLLVVVVLLLLSLPITSTGVFNCLFLPRKYQKSLQSFCGL
jgi:hypothetical protein